MATRFRNIAVISALGFGLVLVSAACDSNPTQPKTPGPKPPPPGPQPGGLFRLEGIIQDGPFWVPHVEVTVIEGAGEGLVTRANAHGSFTVDGVGGTTRLRFQKDGYPDQIDQVSVTADRRQTFFLGRGVARPDYTGTYALTISAAGSCATALPRVAQRRVYSATIEGQGYIQVTLSDADFVTTRNGPANNFIGTVDPSGGIVFSLGLSDIFYEWFVNDVEERLGANGLVINGIATTKGTQERISGTFEGTIGVTAESRTFPRSYLSQCTSDEHGFEMVRR